MFAQIKKDLKAIFEYIFSSEKEIPIRTYSSKIFLNEINYPERVSIFEGDSSDQDLSISTDTDYKHPDI